MYRCLSIVTALLLVGLCCPTPARADVKMDEQTKKATHRALEWLAARQNADGSWTDGRYAHNTAITAFALLAFMSQGHLPNQGQFGPEVAKGARFLLATARAAPGEISDGYLVGARGGNMYCHAMATLALAELWGQTGDDEIRPVLKKAVDLIVRSQNYQGGWRYEPRPTGADISVTIMQVMALRAAKNGGIHVKDEVLNKAIGYIMSCYNPGTGGFSYQSGGGAPGFARTAAGLCVLVLSGKYKDQARAMLDRGVEYLKRNFHTGQHFFYGHYYAAHAMHSYAGINVENGMREWENWYSKIRDYLLPRQSGDGSWLGVERGGVGPVYQTSIAVIILSVPAHYLPIFQR
ncbi:MAG TPA: prenyltransferase/squalene oxidase repeat-containing protein [Gemmataceae bacterium]|nr:prenyltransferase/squalene oxidase repeat-containing protein [Gemmataceae bacterium]